jgi:hypothetical protein
MRSIHLQLTVRPTRVTGLNPGSQRLQHIAPRRRHHPRTTRGRAPTNVHRYRPPPRPHIHLHHPLRGRRRPRPFPAPPPGSRRPPTRLLRGSPAQLGDLLPHLPQRDLHVPLDNAQKFKIRRQVLVHVFYYLTGSIRLTDPQIRQPSAHLHPTPLPWQATPPRRPYMSALPAEPPPHNPYRLAADEGPQTLAELRAALAQVAPADLAAFDARLAATRLDQVPEVISEYRHVWAIRTRPEITAAIEASTRGEQGTLRPAHEAFAAWEGPAA